MSGRKTVLITGAGSGIGRALALQAATLGFDLILSGRTKSTLDETAGMIKNVAVKVIPADVTTPQGRAGIVVAVGGKLDILINNAGTLSVGQIADITDAQIEQMVAVNFTAPMALTRDLLPALTTAKGRIVNIGSVFGDIAYPFFATYSATKFGLRGYSDALRRELSGKGVGVTYIAPRATSTAVETKFASLVEPLDMALDTPKVVAKQAWAAILAGKRESFPKGKERFYVKVQRLFPSLVDKSIQALVRDPKVLNAVSSK
jgi:short-subunit dehydrogenase